MQYLESVAYVFVFFFQGVVVLVLFVKNVFQK